MPAESEGPASSGGDSDAGESPEERRMHRALAEIRREGWKVAVVYAAVDAALATLVSNLVLSVWRPPFVPAEVALPGMLADALGSLPGVTLADGAVGGGVVVAVAVGVLVFAVEVGVRVRRPLVEQFEAANPGLRESLRTARDALEDGRRTRIARRLYGDVLEELRSASSLELLDRRRLTATVVALAIVSLASIQLAAVDVALGGGDGPGDDEPTLGGQEEYAGLQDPSSILGEAEDVSAGENTLDAVVDTSGSGSAGGREVEAAAAYDSGGFAGSAPVESQQAEFAATERIQDAALIREYNLRIRGVEDG